MRYIHLENTICRNKGLALSIGCGLLLLIGVSLNGMAHAAGASTRASNNAATQPLSIQIHDDRMTVAVAGAPQVYLYGVIDADAPRRFEALVRSGKIPAGVDIYLNASQGSVAAGMALGRLFRAGSMATHLGTPRRKGHAGYQGIKAAVCSGACVYAYFGGLYRWAPTGSDRVGLIRPQALPGAGSTARAVDDVHAYLKDMGIDLDKLAPMPPIDTPVWLSASQMSGAGLANNGRLPLKTKSWLLPPTPFLEFSQTDRKGSHRLVLQCQPGTVTLTAYDQVGKTRAQQIVTHETRSYFEINRKEVLVHPRGAARAVDGEVVITRPYPPTELVNLLSAYSIGAWVGGRTSAFRYGSTFVLYPARSAIKDFYNACWRVAPWPLTPASSSVKSP